MLLMVFSKYRYLNVSLILSFKRDKYNGRLEPSDTELLCRKLTGLRPATELNAPCTVACVRFLNRPPLLEGRACRQSWLISRVGVGEGSSWFPQDL